MMQEQDKHHGLKKEVLQDLIKQMNDIMAEKFGGKPAKMEIEMHAEPMKPGEMHSEMKQLVEGSPEEESMESPEEEKSEGEDESQEDPKEESMESPSEESSEDDMDSEDSPKAVALMRLKKSMKNVPVK